MRLLLTSGGVTNDSIRTELVRLLGKPFDECRALLVPTAQWGHPACDPETVFRTIAGGEHDQPGLSRLGWKSIGVLELTALPSIPEDRWVPWVSEADVLLVDGGEAGYLRHWMRESGLLDRLEALPELVWVGVSAGSMVLTTQTGVEFLSWRPDAGDEMLGLVDFAVFPHLDYPGWSGNTMEAARRWMQNIPGVAYAIDHQTAISVDDGVVRVISEGRWERLDSQSDPLGSAD